MRPRPAKAAALAKPKPAVPGRPAPRWLHPAMIAIAVMIALSAFSAEITDTDFWWHLKTGQYISQTHSLPDPDPFAFTTAAAPLTYPGEAVTRRFNLTHEWLAQLALYWTYAAAGFGGIVLVRALLLSAFCAAAGYLAWRRCGGFYRSLAAGLAAITAVTGFAADRPYLCTFVLLAATFLLLESRNPRAWWVIPPMMLIWANCHGGFVLGWIVLLIRVVEAVYSRIRKRPLANDRHLYAVCGVSILISGLNPNGFRVWQVLANYQKSFLTATLIEWRPPFLWPPSAFTVLLAACAVTLAISWRRVRFADWLLFAAFAVAGLMAGRNTFLIGLLAPVLIVCYLPGKKVVGAWAEFVIALLLAGGLAAQAAQGQGFQFRAAQWQLPSGAADFLLKHGITQPMFNTYEYGGYLMWRLWPHQRVFIDGRALSESLFEDYVNILGYNDGGDTANRLLDRYGIGVIVMNGFEFASGQRYPLALGLAGEEDTPWKLVFADPQAVVFVRNPPPGMPVLDSLQMPALLESQCSFHMEHEPRFPGCARDLGQMYSSLGDFARARQWLGTYLERAPGGGDSEAREAYQKMLSNGQ